MSAIEKEVSRRALGRWASLLVVVPLVTACAAEPAPVESRKKPVADVGSEGPRDDEASEAKRKAAAERKKEAQEKAAERRKAEMRRKAAERRKAEMRRKAAVRKKAEAKRKAKQPHYKAGYWSVR